MKNPVLKVVPPVQRTANVDYQVPFDDQNFTLTEQTIDAHHVLSNTVRNNKLSYFDITFVGYKDQVLDLQVPFGKLLTRLRITILPTHLLVCCSCNEHTEKLCAHAHKVLMTLVSRRDSDYFARFYKPDLFKLAEGYPDLFETKTSLEGIRFEAAKTLGTVYIPSQKISMPQSETVTDQHPTITHNQVGYSLYTIFRQEHFPFLAGFTGQLLNDGSAIKSISTIFQTSAAPEHIVFTDQQLMLNAIGSRIQTTTEQLLQIQEANTARSLEEVVAGYTTSGLSQIQTYRQRLLDLWSRAHPLLAGERFVNRYSDGRKIKFDHKPKKGYTKPFQAASSELGVSFTLTKQEACYRLQLHVLKDTNPLDYYELFPARSPLFVFDKRIGVYLLASTLRDIDLITSLTITEQVLTVMDIHFGHFNKSVLQFLTRHYPFQYDSVGADQRTLQVKQMQLRIFEHADSFCFQPQVDYGQELLVPTLSGGTSWIEIHGQPVIFIRDKAKEAALSELVRSLHTDFASQTCKNEDCFSLPKTTTLNTGCLPDMLSKLKENQITVTGIEDIEALVDYMNLVDIRMDIHADKDWFEITLKASCSQIPISNEVLRHAILENDEQLSLKDGTHATIPASWQKKLKTVLSFSQPSKSGMRLSCFHAQLLDQLNDQSGQQGLQGFADNPKSHKTKIKVITDRKVPDNVRATLRAYQKEGFDWLMFLKDNGWGGILADDMGLGKTLQVLTLLQNVYKSGLHARPSLLIVPTSLLFNWQQEAEKFTPDLRVVRYHGAFRQQQASRLDSGDVILTTYKTVLHDIDILRHAQFEYLILDEAQAIKNSSSQRYKAISILDARIRLAMTGTPVENSGNDLYALMNFVNPGMLGSLRGFNKLLSNRAETDAVSYWQKVINTFILRRTKKQVAKDLPEKTEMVIYCEMETQQRAVYDAYRIRYQNAIKEKLSETGAVNSKLYALAGLLKLRQICNAPVLVEAQVEKEAEPAKIKELMRRLKEITPFHKVLVFSSFTGFLGLIRQQLEKYQLGYAYLDGKTKEDQRSKMVDLFQNDDHTRVFLISLKAGGTGLNLTAAEYVFLIDPWWNPAAESQAIDRCYRIGQENNVMAYRMICKDTLEEKILNMQAQKRQLADELVSSTDGVLKSFSEEDILELFS